MEFTIKCCWFFFLNYYVYLQNTWKRRKNTISHLKKKDCHINYIRKKRRTCRTYCYRLIGFTYHKIQNLAIKKKKKMKKNWRKLDICNDIVDTFFFRMTSVTVSPSPSLRKSMWNINCIQTIYFIGMSNVPRHWFWSFLVMPCRFKSVAVQFSHQW